MVLRATGKVLAVPQGDVQSAVIANLPIGALVVDDSGTLFTKKASGWGAIGSGKLSLSFQFGAAETSTTKGVVVAQPAVIPATAPGSQAKGTAAPSSATVYTLNKNGSSIGSVSVAATTGVATFTFAAAVTLAAGDIVTAVSPAALNSIGISYITLLADIL